MSWLLFMDESGHDHRTMPFEVRGGVALHASKLWPFIQGWRRLEEDSFGTTLTLFGKEAKGQKLLDKDRFKWAGQSDRMPDDERRKQARTFLERGQAKQAPTQTQFTAYGQASLEMARGAFDLLIAHDARLFATLIPKGVKPPAGFDHEDYLRKDHVFLLERFYYFRKRCSAATQVQGRGNCTTLLPRIKAPAPSLFSAFKAASSASLSVWN